MHKLKCYKANWGQELKSWWTIRKACLKWMLKHRAWNVIYELFSIRKLISQKLWKVIANALLAKYENQDIDSILYFGSDRVCGACHRANH